MATLWKVLPEFIKVWLFSIAYDIVLLGGCKVEPDYDWDGN